jgi:glutamate-ammonia-ligase adenylyltransferase
MVHDAQTHRIPGSADGIARIACLMGTDAATLTAGLTRRLTEVHDLTEGFFAPDAAPTPRPVAPPAGLDASVLARWPGYPALRSPRAAQIFETRIRPGLLARIMRTARPDEALLALDGFLAGLPAGVQLFSLFEANPQLIDLLVDIVGTSADLAEYLSRNSAVFDAVIGGDFFADWPGCDHLSGELAARMAAESDYETQLDMARRWTREWRFRVGVHHLRGLIDGVTAAGQYADLASAVITALAPVVETQFARRHGPPPGRGAAILGMGSLGAGRLTSTSDLDVIVIYDAAGIDASEGRRPLPARLYYARLTQALITALTAPMSQGRLYEVDMRLRPSGTQGPVATSWSSFTQYQDNDAWMWEHLALTRARPIAGAASLCADIESFRRDLIARPRDRAAVLGEMAAMRDRIAAARAPAGPWDTKTGPGRVQDIELVAQTGALLSGTPCRDVAAGLQGAVTAGWLGADEVATLSASYSLSWAVHMAARLISGGAMDIDTIGEGGAEFLCRAAGHDDITALQAALEAAYGDSAAIIAAALSREGGESDEG